MWSDLLYLKEVVFFSLWIQSITFQEAMSIIRTHDKNKPLFLTVAFQSMHKPLVGNPPKRQEIK